MKITKIHRTKHFAICPDHPENYPSYIWYVKPNEKYDLIQFKVDGIYTHYWDMSLCVPPEMSDEEVRKLVEEYASTITDEAVKGYKEFIAFGEKYGWD